MAVFCRTEQCHGVIRRESAYSTGSYFLISLTSINENNCYKVDRVGGEELLPKNFDLEGQMRL